MKTSERAVQLHGEGFSCAQSVLMSLKGLTGLTEECSADLGAGFGRGAGVEELCGAISGAVLAMSAVGGAKAKPQILEKNRELCAAFRERFGAVRCEELKAAEISCDEAIAFAAEKAEELIGAGFAAPEAPAAK